MHIARQRSSREHRLAVFCLLIASLAFSACGKNERAAQQETAEEEDLYTLEVRKDRLEKDKYFLSSPNSPIKASDLEYLKGLAYYPVDKAFAFHTALRRLPEPAEVTVATSKNRPRIMLHLGELPFMFEGAEYALQVFAPKDTSEGNYWFIPFTDATSGGETYGAGRFLDIEDISSDSTVLDFNYAYNPYCAYNERYDCPIPPPENHLPIEIRAGEKEYPLHHGK